MFFVFGSDHTTVPLESLITAACCQCGKETSWTLWKETEWASLFFIRILPILHRYHLGCNGCGYGLPLEKTFALQLLAPENRTRTLHDTVVQIISEDQQRFISNK